MSIASADVTVASTGDIRWIAPGDGSGPYTVLELHRFLQGLADDAQAASDDILDITSSTPSERSTDNIITLLGNYNVDEEMVQHLYNGSITQTSGDEIYSGLVVVGSTNLATTLMVIQNNALYDDTVHTPSTPFWGTGLNADAANNILMRCMIKTRTGGSDIDGQRLRIQAREYTDTYAEFEVTMGLGNSTAAIFTNADLNNTTAVGTVATWTTINNEHNGYYLIDLNNDEGAQPYYSEWNRDSYTINQLYERAKWNQRRGETTTDLYGLDGELFRGITHEASVDNPGGTFASYEAISWTGGTGQMLAIDSPTAATKIWFQLLTGTAPTDGLTITGTGTADVDKTVTSRTISPCFLGQSTGTALIGAYGIGVESTDVTYTDKLFDLTNTQRVPPNNVEFTVSGLVVGEDYVLVASYDGSGIQFDQFTLNGALSGGTVTTVNVNEVIPSDTPTTGTATNSALRVLMDNGIYAKIEYESWTASAFTIPSTNFGGASNCADGNNAFVSYIDVLAASVEESFTTKYDDARTLYVRVRDGGGTPIKTFESPSALGAAGGTATAIRTSDA